MNNQITRVFDILNYQFQKYPQQKALSSFVGSNWKSHSIQEVISFTDRLALKFLDQGFKKGDKVAIMPKIGRPEWMIIDFACQQIGVVLVPLHPTANEGELQQIMAETQPKACVAADAGLSYKLQVALNKTQVEAELFHLEAESPGFLDVLKKNGNQSGSEELDNIRASIKPEDLVCILYTSGSTGRPKGVMLTHHNIVCNVIAAMSILPLSQNKRVMSFLPFSHVLERTTVYVYVAFGANIYFSTSRESFTHDFKSVKPYFCTMVPRVLEKMYEYLEEQALSKNWLKKTIFRKVISIASQYHTPHKIAPIYRLSLFFARVFVLHWWKQLLGGSIKYMAVGAAALRPEIGRMFSAAKITVREGYGMTETSPLISINRFNAGLNKFGTAGIPIPGLEVKIDHMEGDEGEILVKGPNITQGYYQQPDTTKELFTSDGWMKTGDVGTFVDEKFLQITDRRKDIFKTSSGKYIAPLPLQTLFMSSSFVLQCLIIGFQRPYVTALIVPSFDILKRWCEQENIHWTSPQYMIHNIKVIAKIQAEIDAINEQLPNYKRVRDFVLGYEEWSVESGEMTASYKPIRKVLLAKFEKQVEKIYST